MPLLLSVVAAGSLVRRAKLPREMAARSGDARGGGGRVRARGKVNAGVVFFLAKN